VIPGGGEEPVERLLEIVRAYPQQVAAVAALLVVVILAWAVESSSWRTRHR
jgi:hypothetical protein